MLRVLLGITLAISCTAAGAKPPPKILPAPPDPAVAHADDICTDAGGFGRSFGRGYGHVDTTADEEWAPFTKLVITGREIRATVSFRGHGDSREADEALAQTLAKALDKAVTEKGHFPHRQASGGRFFFNTSKEPGTGLSFEIHLMEDRVLAVCTSLE